LLGPVIMPKTDNEIRITPSVFDRLLGYDQDDTPDPSISRTKGMRLLKQAVKRDLEWLFNTRQVVEGLSPDLKELNSSLAAYGLPDLSSVNIKSPPDQRRLRAALENAINVFEPRLEGVVVTLEPIGEGEQVMRFRISARLKIEPTPEPVTFDTTMQLSSGKCVLQEG
jgi:type VI secretion system protein ImpF